MIIPPRNARSSTTIVKPAGRLRPAKRYCSRTMSPYNSGIAIMTAPVVANSFGARSRYVTNELIARRKRFASEYELCPGRTPLCTGTIAERKPT